jgi:hypothetical protein
MSFGIMRKEPGKLKSIFIISIAWELVLLMIFIPDTAGCTYFFKELNHHVRGLSVES